MNIIESFFSFLAPHQCFVCGTEGSVLCNSCRFDLVQQVPSRCAGCQKKTLNYQTCNKCRQKIKASHIFVATNYSSNAERLVKQVKFAYKRQGIGVMADIMCDSLPFLPEDTLVCPIPTAPKRVRTRGFDHSVLIARRMTKLVSRSYTGCLHRQTNTRQVGAGRKKRFEQMAEAFYVSNSEMIKNKTILIVDDVFTTGATIAGAVDALKKAGAKEVYASVFTQKVS